MIIGNPSVFAIDYGITKAYERVSLRALGFFVIHMGGRQYGIRAPNATMLACSFDEVTRRLAWRGRHTAPFADGPNAASLAEAFRTAVYSTGYEKSSFFGLLQPEFAKTFYSNRIIWAPDGDEAFDDGSYVLQFDIEGQVRLIAFKCLESGRPAPDTICEVRLKADKFYGVLQEWCDVFEAEWLAKPKTPDAG